MNFDGKYVLISSNGGWGRKSSLHTNEMYWNMPFELEWDILGTFFTINLH